MSVNALAARIKALAADPERNVQYVHGTITTTHAANPPIGASVDVTVLGVAITSVPYLSSYTPAVADEVEMLLIGATAPVLLVLGKCA